MATISMGGIFALLGELRDKLGFTESELGVMVAAGFFAGFIAQVGLARFSDRGHSNSMIRLGLVLLVVSQLLMGLASSLWAFVVARVVLGFGTGVFLPAIRRLVIVSDRKNMGANVGMLSAFDVGGFVAGPVLAGLVAHFFGLRSPFFVLAAAIAAFAPLTLRLRPDPGVTTSERRVVRTLLRIRAVQVVLLAVVGWFVMIGTFEAIWAVMLADLGAEVWFTGVTAGMIALPMLVLAAFSGRFAHRVGPLKVSVVGVLWIAPCVTAYGYINSLNVIIVVAVIHGLSDAFVFPANQVGIALAAGEDLAASAQGLMGAMLQLVGGLVAIVAGGVYEQWGREVVYVTNAAIIVVFAAVAAWMARPLATENHPVVVGSAV